MWPTRLYGERPLTGRRPYGPAIVDVANALVEALGLPPLSVYLGDAAPQAIDIRDVELVTALLGDLRDHGRPFIVANAPTAWTLLVAAQEASHLNLQYIDVPMAAADEAPPAPTATLARLTAQIGADLDADLVVIEDAALAATYAGDRPIRVGLANLPADSGVGPDDFPPSEPVPGVVDGIPELRLATEIDRSRVPAGVYWINWWRAPLVESIGRARVRAAAWALVDERPDGSMVLAVSESPPVLGDPSDVAHLAGIIDAIDLRAAQERHLGPRALPT